MWWQFIILNLIEMDLFHKSCDNIQRNAIISS